MNAGKDSPHNAIQLEAESKPLIDSLTSDQRDEDVMQSQEVASHPQMENDYLHNLSDFIASSDIKPVELKDTDVNGMWFGNEQLNKTCSTTSCADREENVESTQQSNILSPSSPYNVWHTILGRRPVSSGRGNVSSEIDDPLFVSIKVEPDLMVDNTSDDTVNMLVTVKSESRENDFNTDPGKEVETNVSFLSRDEQTVNLQQRQKESISTTEEPNIILEEAHARISNEPGSVTIGDTAAKDDTASGAVKVVKKRGRPRKAVDKLCNAGLTQRSGEDSRRSQRLPKRKKFSFFDDDDDDNDLAAKTKSNKKAVGKTMSSPQKPQAAPKETRIRICNDAEGEIVQKGLPENVLCKEPLVGSAGDEQTSISTSVHEERATTVVDKVLPARDDKELEMTSGNEGAVEKMECKYCKAYFASVSDLRVHDVVCKLLPSAREKPRVIFPVDDKRNYCCPICHKKLFKLNGVKRHMTQNHLNLLRITCNLCGYRIRQDLVNHMQTFHRCENPKTSGDKYFPCPLCGEPMWRGFHLTEHVFHRHSDAIEITCSLCQRALESVLGFFYHFQVEHVQSSSRWNSGDACITTPPAREVRKRERTLQPDRGYVCSLCNKSLDNHKLLTLHILSHKVNDNLERVSRSLDSILLKETEEKDSSAFHTECRLPIKNTNSQVEIPISPSANNADTNFNVTGSFPCLGADAVSGVKRSLSVMTQLCSKLRSELQWKSIAPLGTIEDLCGQLNSVLNSSGSISDMGKCMLLNVEERSQTDINDSSSGIEKQEGFYEVEENTVDNGDEDIRPGIEVDKNDSNICLGNEVNKNDGDICLGNEVDKNDSNICVGNEVDKNDGDICLGNEVDENGDDVCLETGVDKSNGDISLEKDERKDSEMQDKSARRKGRSVSRVEAVSLEVGGSMNLVAGENLDGEQDSPEATSEYGGIGSEDESKALNPTECEPESESISNLSENVAPDSVVGSRKKKTALGPKQKKSKKSVRKTVLRKKEAQKSEKTEGRKTFQCNICGKHLSRATKLKNHKLCVHTDIRPFTCTTCSVSFKCRAHLKRHAATHLKVGNLKCDFCHSCYKSLKDLHAHLSKHEDASLFSCDECKHQARTSHEIAIHHKLHEPKPCKQCEYKAKNFNDLQAHQRKNHHKFFCSKCEYSCAANHALKRHMLTHDTTGPKEMFCCELCGKTFGRRALLQYHMVRHKNKTPFSCPHCDYRCSSKTSYTAHILKHEGRKPFECNVCGARFVRSHYLKGHALTHLDEKQYNCEVCGKGFKYKNNFVEHQMIHTGEKRYKCHLCNFACRRKKLLAKHIESHRTKGSDAEVLSENEPEEDRRITRSTVFQSGS